MLSADNPGDLLESRPLWTAVSSALQLFFVLFDVRQDVQAWATPGWSCGQCDLGCGENA